MARFHISNNTENPFSAISKAMEEMREFPGATLVIEPGEYIITAPRAKEIQKALMSGEYTYNPQPVMFSEKFVHDRLFDFDGHKNTTVEAYGAKFIIDGFMENVSFRNCRDCTFRGGDFDHMRRPWSRGIITSQDGCTVTAQFPEEYDFSDSAPHVRVFIVNPKNAGIQANFYVESTRSIGNLKEIKLTNQPKECIGKYIYIWHTYHSRPCFLIYNSKNTVIQDSTVRTHPGMAVTAQVSENITLKRLKVIPPEGEFVSTNTDSVHIASCRGKLTMEDGMFVGMGDDGLNVHTYYMDILSAEKNTVRIAIATYDGTHAQLPCPPSVGDTVELTVKDSLEVKEKFKITDVLETGFNRYSIELDRPVDGDIDIEKMYFADANAVPETVVRNCVFKNHFARGVLIKCRKALIENCLFDNIADSAVKIAPQGSWKEGISSEDVTVKGCKITNCGWLEMLCGGIYAYNESPVRTKNVHGKITVEGCSFENMPTKNIIIENTEKPVINQ